MGKTPLVSVVVPMYNAEKYVADCICSVLAQTLADWELLLVDDGSRDKSAAVASPFREQDHRVRLLHHPNGENLGVSRSRLLGVSEAKGSYIAFLDADDVYAPNKLERQLQSMQRHPDCVMCHTGIWAISEMPGNHARNWERCFNVFRPRGAPYSFHTRPNALDGCHICNSSSFVKADALRSLGFAYPQLFQHEDWGLWLLLSERGPFFFLDAAVTGYRVHPASFCSGNIDNPLRTLYSRVELYLSLMTRSQDENTLRRAEDRLFNVLGQIAQIYRNGNSDGPPPSLRAEASEQDARLFWRRYAERVESQLATMHNSLTWRWASIVHRVIDRLRGRA